MVTTIFKMKKKSLAPQYLAELLPGELNEKLHHNLRNNDQIAQIGDQYLRLELLTKSFFPHAINLWNELPSQIRNITVLDNFKTTLNKGKNN